MPGQMREERLRRQVGPEDGQGGRGEDWTVLVGGDLIYFI